MALKINNNKKKKVTVGPLTVLYRELTRKSLYNYNIYNKYYIIKL